MTGGEVGVIVGGTDLRRRVDVGLTLDIGAGVGVAVGKLDGGAVGVTDGGRPRGCWCEGRGQSRSRLGAGHGGHQGQG